MPSIPSAPECPLCGEKLECFHQKRQDVFAVLHGRGNGRNFSIVPCKARFTEFSRGATEDLAWEAAEEKIREYQDKLSQHEETETKQSSPKTLSDPNHHVLPESEY